jgi:Neprosin/Neprosin activation peptide
MASDDEAGTLQSFGDFYRSLNSATHEQYQTRLFSRVSSPDAFEAQRKHLLDLYKGVEVRHSFVDNSGQIFDCIPIDQQPALKKSGKPLASPPKLPIGNSQTAAGNASLSFLHPECTDRFGHQMACPTGTVAVRRITLEEMSRFEDLEHFLRKGPRSDRKRVSQLFSPPDAPNAAEPPHEYAHAYQQVSSVGGHSFLNIWTPTVSGSQIFSLSQQWYVATGDAGLQTVEVGWQVFPQKYGHSNPVLFTYWTADGYQKTGAYSNDAGDFVQHSSDCPVGIALEQTSISGGAQAELELSFLLSDGNWWLFVNGNDAAHAVGYYPVALYQNGPMTTGAQEIDYGGETVGTGSYPPMGSGAFAVQGYQKAAYHRNISYFPPGGGVQNTTLDASQDWPDSYTIAVQQSDDWGEYFFFGGPGSAAQMSAASAQSVVGTLPSLAPGQITGGVPKPAGPASTSAADGAASSRPPASLWMFLANYRWACLTILFIGLLAACGAWITTGAWSHSVSSVPAQWLAVEATLLGLCVLSGYAVNKRPDGILIDEENRISLGRIQWVAWFVILMGGFFTESIWNISLGQSFPTIQKELLELLGIVTGSAVTGSLIVDSKKNATNAPPPPINPQIGTPTQKGAIDCNVDPVEASWADLYLGDEVATRNVVDVSRLQKLVVTVLLVMTYVELLWGKLGGILNAGAGAAGGKTASTIVGHFASMPNVDSNFLWLLGISHAAYLAYKATPKTPSS